MWKSCLITSDLFQPLKGLLWLLESFLAQFNHCPMRESAHLPWEFINHFPHEKLNWCLTDINRCLSNIFKI